MNFPEMVHSGNVAMTNDDLMKNAPSVFSKMPHDGVSDRYGFVSTIEMVDAMRGQGWYPVSASQKNVRSNDRVPFTKHLVKFRRLDDNVLIGEDIVELNLRSAHDRTSSVVVHGGLMRMACANGLWIPSCTLKELSVRHNKFAVENIIEGVYEIIDDIPAVAENVESMKATNLLTHEKLILADTVREFVFGENENIVTKSENINQQLITPRRNADTGSDLWSTFNVIQENVIRGGVKTIRKGLKGYRHNTTRKITGMDKDAKLNKALWSMAVAMRDLKG